MLDYSSLNKYHTNWYRIIYFKSVNIILSTLTDVSSNKLAHKPTNKCIKLGTHLGDIVDTWRHTEVGIWYVTPCILIRYQYIGSTDSWNNADLSIFYTSGYKFGRSLSIANNPVIWYFIFCCWVSVEVHDRRIHDVWRSEELWCCAFQRTKRHITIIISLVADVKRDEAYSKILISRCVLPLW